MLQYKIIDASEGIDINKSNKITHYFDFTYIYREREYSTRNKLFFVKAFDNVFLNYISTLKYCCSYQIYKQIFFYKF